ncbi:MAG: hypothetical protein GMKNLPBB_01570 [Myxococcota bacterium]|nr:hypothetical protein [Myxococcota bacterium]
MIELFTMENILALLTLTAMEIVLGMDNVVFIAILTGGLPEKDRKSARNLGLGLAVVTRILLLLSISWVMKLTAPLVEVAGRIISGKSLVLLLGGGFLIFKATWEIHHKIEGAGDPGPARTIKSLANVVMQILVLDIVFSLDSVITAVGMAKDIRVMVAAVIIAVAVMLVFAGPVSNFVERHPTMKMLALAFLILIGVMLTAEGMGTHIDKGYIYFAMAFSLAVEMLNLWLRQRQQKAGQAG